MLKNKKINLIFSKLTLFLFILNSCVGSSSVGVFGSGVSIAFDPRTVGMQIDDSIMQKNLMARLALSEKKYLLSVSVKVLDGNIFLSGKVEEPEEKLKITKMAWETKGTRSVKSAITIKGETNFKNTAMDILITSQLRTAFIFNKLIKATNYNIDTINENVYIFGISMTSDEKKEVIKEANEIYGVKKVIPSIILVEDLSRNKN
ncbi:MAG: phospholipid-binding protein [Candidatus Pelagibacter sp.]|nr:phospholipid-binding protein [Candidatus Pelagibacter sp.]|tara:strand:+ start:889 stop:1500 length:612 start_codon:yes stop_codon:yes gene_type:complete